MLEERESSRGLSLSWGWGWIHSSGRGIGFSIDGWFLCDRTRKEKPMAGTGGGWGVGKDSPDCLW